MKLWICSIAISLGANASAQNAEDAIRKLTTDFNLAYENDDLDTYFGYYADGATLWFASGRAELDDYKKSWYDLVEGGGEVVKATVSDLRVKVNPSGDSAVASYVLHVDTRYPDGRLVKERAWESDVWFRIDGAWKIVHLHYAQEELP